MPLETRIVRNGESLQLRWGEFHVCAMILASAIDSGKGPFKDNTLKGILSDEASEVLAHYPDKPIWISPSDCFTLVNYPVLSATVLSEKGYMLKSGHHFHDSFDEECFELIPGDILSAYRTM